MDAFVDIIQTLGFPIACVVACAFFIYKIVLMDRTEALNRESKLHDMLKENGAILDKAASTMEASDKTLCELSETNKLLAQKIEIKLDNMSSTLESIADKVDDLS